MKRGALWLVVSGLVVSGVLGAQHASYFRHLDPPEPLEAQSSARERAQLVAIAEERGWIVDRRMQVHVSAEVTWLGLEVPPVPIAGVEAGWCVAAIASVSGMIVAHDLHFEDEPLQPREEGVRGCGVDGGRPFRTELRSALADVTCEAQRSSDRRLLHVTLDPLWTSDSAQPAGTVELVLLRARRDALDDDALELPAGRTIDRSQRARGAYTVSRVHGFRRGVIVLAGWSVLGGGLLLGGGSIAARRRRLREGEEAARARTVRRITLSIPRAMRAELTSIVEDAGADDLARLRRLRDALASGVDAISAVALVRWRGPAAQAYARMETIERDVRALEHGDAGYREGGGERVALTLLVLHSTELLGFDVPLDQEGLASMLYASVPLEPAALDALRVLWTPADPGAGMDDVALAALLPGLLPTDGAMLRECAACGAVRRATEPRCASCGRVP